MPVTNVDGIRMPIDLHVRKYRAIVDVTGNLDGLLHIALPLGKDLRVSRLIRVDQCLSDCLMGCLPGWIIVHHGLYNQLLHPGESWRNLAFEEGLINAAVRRRKPVCRTIVTIDAIHVVPGQIRQLILTKPAIL